MKLSNLRLEYKTPLFTKVFYFLQKYISFMQNMVVNLNYVMKIFTISGARFDKVVAGKNELIWWNLFDNKKNIVSK